MGHGYSNETPRHSRGAPYTVRSKDGRVTATVYAGQPAYVQVRYESMTEDAVEAALLDMAANLPPLCCIVTLPQGWPV